eukprot:TRINITY_DN1568_c0_g1_i13.p1 TRINITY_DN1568_c0_g1~~TRINITY_DN1568_c0_g1_i13.p1  ORF type:complete len:489 (+),score=101.79 TRINITY_DN1568_c0_g1_i13:139-1605(+)
MAQLFRVIPLPLLGLLTIVILWTTIGYHQRTIEIGNADARATLEYIAINAAAQPINKLYAIRVDENCPEGTSRTEIGKYSGLKDAGSEERLLYKWGKRYNICIRRNTNVIWLDEGESSCPGGYRICTNNACVPTSEDCPYVDLRVNTGTTPSAETRRLLSQTHKRFNRLGRYGKHRRDVPNTELKNRFPSLGTDQEVEPGVRAFFDTEGNYQIFSFRRGINSSPSNTIVSLNITYDGPPCVTPDRYSARLGSSFPSERVSRTGCGDFGADGSEGNSPDDRFASNLATQREVETYRKNDITVPESFANYLGTYHMARLTARRKIRAKSIKKCQEVSQTQLIAINDTYNKFYKTIKTLYVVLYILLGLAIIIQVAALIFKPIFLGRRMILILCVVIIILSFLMIIPSIVYSSNRNDASVNINKLKACKPQSPFSKAFDRINADLDKTNNDLSTQTQILLWVGLVSLILAALYAVLVVRAAMRARRYVIQQ